MFLFCVLIALIRVDMNTYICLSVDHVDRCASKVVAVKVASDSLYIGNCQVTMVTVHELMLL